MHVVMFIDEERFKREARMLNGLARGLSDLGARVTRVLPTPVAASLEDRPDDAVIPGVEDYAYPPRVMPWQRRIQIRRWPEVLLDADVALGIGTSAWRWAVDFARVAEAAAVLDIWCAEQVRRATRPKKDSPVCGYLAATRPLADALASQVGSELVSHVPWGLPARGTSRRSSPVQCDEISIAMIDAGLDIESYQAVLGAVRRLLSEGVSLQLVVELRGPQGHSLWQYARQLDLLDHIACVSDAADCRPLIVECNLLLIPDRFGQMRSIILEAMAHGLPIVAAADPMIEVLAHDKSALLVAREEPDAWYGSIRKLLMDKDLYTRIGQYGRELVTQSATRERHVENLLRTLETAVSGSSIPFGSRSGGG